MVQIVGLDIVFTVNGKNVPISSEAFASLVSSLPDSEIYKSIYAEFAKASAFGVRENVAYKDNLDEQTVFLLADDPVESVVENLIRSDAAKYLNEDMLYKLIDRSSKLAADIADKVNNFEDSNLDKLCEVLANHSDPQVRRNLATNYGVPEKVLKKLKSDEDPEVAYYAEKSLE